MTPRKQSGLVGLRADFPNARFFNLDRGDLGHIVDVLNEKGNGQPTFYAEALIRLIERLKEYGGNLKKMTNDDPGLAKAMTEACVALWTPDSTGGAHLVLQQSTKIQALSPMPKTQEEAEERAELIAALLFYVGTLNPEWDKLAGPCKWKHCGKYFLLKGNRRTAYCSRRCCQLDAASRCRQKCLQREHADKLQRAEEAARRWRTARTKDDWKASVSKQEPDITPKFLTRAVNKGELKTPTKGQKP
jgi:hypothetical protein